MYLIVNGTHILYIYSVILYGLYPPPTVIATVTADRAGVRCAARPGQEGPMTAKSRTSEKSE